MSKSHGGTKDSWLGGDANYKGEIKNIETLKALEPSAYQAIGTAIQRFHSVLGVRERNIKLADIAGHVMGVQESLGGKSVGVYLNKKYFKGWEATEISDRMKELYEKGWQTKTNKPVAHVITHELGHALWNSSLTSANAKAAGKEIKALSEQWLRDRKGREAGGYGKYARTNINEFFAETITKAVHGQSDKYTEAIKKIVKKYKL